MSISNTNSRNNYTGNNSTDTYNYTFRIFNQEDLLVTVRNTNNIETTLTLTTNYTVTGVGSLTGGTIVLVDGNLATGYVLSIRRVVELVQETDIRNQGAFYPEIHEDQFDRQVMMAQQQQDEVDRSVKLAETIDPADFDTRLPASIVGAVNRTVMTNATGDGFEPGPTADEVSNAQGYATAAGVSATAAAASQTAAAASASAAALSASAAAASSSASQWNDVQYLTFASSPFTVTDVMAGTLFEVDASGGAVTINLPAISGLTLTGAWSIGVKKTDSSNNAVTASRNGTDTIDGSTTKATSRQYGGFVLVPDTDQSPDKWTSISFGEVPIAGAIVGTTDSQTLTNKTLTAPNISAANITSASTLTDQSDPSSPASGFKAVYAKTDGVYVKNSAGTVRQFAEYIEGTWTPDPKFGGASVGMVASSSGYYTKVGKQVTCVGQIVFSARGSSTGVMTIAGLPFTSSSTAAYAAGSSVIFNSVGGANATNIMSGYVNTSATTANIVRTASGVGTSVQVQPGDFNDASSFFFTIIYMADS